jgi:catechol 2,3-dioxygenase
MSSKSCQLVKPRTFSATLANRSISFVEGSGYSEIGKETVKWASGELIYTPPWAWHRHYNDSDTEVRMLLIEYSGILDHLELNRRERGGARVICRTQRRTRLMAGKRLLHVELGVDDLDQSVEFHGAAFDLQEVGREGDTVYLGREGADGYLLALTGGGTGVRHFSIGVDSSDELADSGKKLAEFDVEAEKRADGEPGQGEALRFTAPSGHVIELVVASQDDQGQLGGSLAPLGIDHIALRAPDVNGLADFLCNALDCKVSDAFSPAANVWGAAWTRFDNRHHDIAVIGGPPDFTLDHLAWGMEGAEHMKTAADALSEKEIPLETGIGRHRLGGNLFEYFWAPGGNRYELTAEMPECDNSEPGIWTDLENAFSAWGHQLPESFQRGS